jgi:hypothetical protein
VTYPFWSAEIFQASGANTGSIIGMAEPIIGRIDNELRTLKHPMDGIEGAAQFFLGLPNGLARERSATFEVIAPYEAALDPEGTHLVDGVLDVGIRAGSRVITSNLRLGMFSWSRDGLPTSSSVDIPTKGWHRRDSGQFHNRITMRLQNRDVCTLFLVTGQRCLHTVTIGGLRATHPNNARQRAYATVDPDLSRFRAALTPFGSVGAAEFERNLPRLFHFLGFTLDVFAGNARIGEGVDALAFHPRDPICLAIECTTGAIASKGKLSKLVARTRELASSLPEFTVHPVVVTSLNRSAVAVADSRAAAADRVIVLSVEDVVHLLAMAARMEPLDQVMAYLYSAIPEASGP